MAEELTGDEMQILYELIGAGVLLGLVYLGIVQIIALIESRNNKGKK